VRVDSPAGRLPTPDLSDDDPRPPTTRVGAALDTALRVIGGILAVAMAVLTAVLELQLAYVRVGGALVGVAALIAAVANFGIAWFAYRVTGSKWAVAPPALVWVAIMLVASGRTTEGDYLLTGWVGLAIIGAGCAALTIAGIRMVVSAPK
jgi:hypothetical protein